MNVSGEEPTMGRVELRPVGLVFLLLAMPWLTPAADMMANESEAPTILLPFVPSPSSSWTSGVTNSTHFTIEARPTAGNPFSSISAAIDANDKIHVSYYDSLAGSVKYATDRSGTWVIKTIDSSSTTNPSIAVDSSGSVHISYVNRSSAELMYATDASGTWETTALHSLKKNSVSPWPGQDLSTSIAIDSNDVIHISYVSTESLTVRTELRYTTNANGTWVSTTVDSDDSGYGVGKSSRIAIDSNDKVHIIFQNRTSGQAGYAHNKNGTWEVEYISGTGSTQGRIQGISIAIDSNDDVHTTYTRTSSNWRLGYARNTGGSWTILNTIGNPSHGTQQVGAYTSIAIDSNDDLHISDQHNSYRRLRYSTNASGSWATTDVGKSSNGATTYGYGYGTSMVIDSNDDIHIINQNQSNGYYSLIVTTQQGTGEGVNSNRITAVRGFGTEFSTVLNTSTVENATIIESSNPPEGIFFSGLGSSNHIVTTQYANTCVISNNGSIMCWGRQTYGANGNGTRSTYPNTLFQFHPGYVRLPAGRTAYQVAGGVNHACAILDNRSTMCWGQNFHGELADGNSGTDANETEPVYAKIPEGRYATQISTAGLSACAVLDNGSAVCWGRGLNGALGNNKTTNYDTPQYVQIPSGRTVKQISTNSNIGWGVSPWQDQTCAVLDNGSVMCWGEGKNGRLGNNKTTDSSVPVFVHLPAGVEATSVAVGWEHACAILDNGSVMCWGKGTGGRIGNNGSISQSDQKLPVNVVLPANRSAIALSASYSHTCAVMDNGSATCWGYNPYGQLGLNGAATDNTRGYFGKAITAEYVELPSGRTVTGVSTHDRHTCWTLDNESVMCTGSNVNYALGRANLSDCTPVSSTVVCNGLMDGTSTTVNVLKYVKWLPKVKTNPGRATWYGTPVDTTNGKTLTAWANTTSTSASARAILRVVPATDYTTASLSIPSSGAISVTPTNNCDWCTYSIEPALPNWMSINTSTAAITGTSPLGNIGFSGTYTITGTASNGSDATTITLTSSASTPTVTLVNGFEASVDTPLNSTVISGASTFETSGSPTNMPFTTTGNGVLDSNSISAAGESSCAVWADGGMKCWGHDGYGQLGNGGTTGNKNTPRTSVSLPSARDAVATTSGTMGHNCAIVDNGDAYCWGEGANGRLGYGKTVDKTSPQKVGLPSGRDAVDISAGGYHSCAVLDNGSAMCWGWNQGGRLGDGTTNQRKNPSYVDLPLGKAATQISAGEIHTCAVMTDGSAYCWGNNNKGQFGIGSTSPSSSSTPVQVSLPSGLKAISIGAGDEFTCALMDDGDVYCWGEGDAGRLGNGATSDKTSPTKITMPSGDAIKLMVGYDMACMIMDSGAARCWGEGSDGQLGEGKTSDRSSSRAVSIPSGRKVTDIHANGWGNMGGDDAHTCAILDNGTAMCWGDPYYGKLGNGGSTTATSAVKSPVYVSLTDGLMPVPETHRWHGTPNTPSSGVTYTNWANNTSSASYSSNLNIRVLGAIDYGASQQALSVGSVNIAGTVYCDWCTYMISPSLPSGLSFNRANGTISGSISSVTYDWTTTFNITALAHNGSNSTTLSLSHQAVSSQSNVTTYLGFKDTISTSIPDTVMDASDSRIVDQSTPGFDFLTDGLNPSDLIDAGNKHTCAALQNGSLACWGQNSNAELGLGFVSSLSGVFKYADPQYVELGLDAKVKQISSGTNHVCVVLDDGRLSCWGSNIYYQLGRGYANSSSTNLTATPTVVDLGTGVKVAQAATGDAHTCIMTQTGAIKCWGKNGAGQIGAGYKNTSGTYSVHTPVDVDLGTGRTAIAVTAGDEYTCAILDNGELVCWGLNWKGQLGLGSTTDKSSPQTVDLGTGRTAVAIAAGSSHTCAILDNGNIKCWGFNGDGSLGIGSTTDSRTPVKVSLGTNTAKQVSIGERQTCAILDDDSMSCWGANDRGQLGLGGTGTSDKTSPKSVNVGSGRTVIGLTTGDSFTCAVLDNQNTSCWGANTHGQLGLGFLTSTIPYGRTTPTVLTNLTEAMDGVVKRGEWLGTANQTGVYDRMVWANSTTSSYSTTVRITVLEPFGYTSSTLNVPSSGALSHTPSQTCTWCTFTISPELPSWMSFNTTTGEITGTSSLGSLGFTATYTVTGTSTNGTYSKDVTLSSEGTTPSVTVVKGFYTSINTLLDRSMIENSTSIESDDLVPDLSLYEGRVNNSVIDGGWQHSCALQSNGSILCWGKKRGGWLGDGDSSCGNCWNNVVSNPVYVDLPANRTATDMSGGRCAVLDNGSAMCWGMGMLGDGNYYHCVNTQYCYGGSSLTYAASPVYLTLPTGREAISISFGTYLQCVVLDNGSAMCTGFNDVGQIGDGSICSSSTYDAGCSNFSTGWPGNSKVYGKATPSYVSIPTGRTVTALEAYNDFACAILDNGSVMCWGEGSDGRLGNDDTNDSSIPVYAHLPSGSRAVALSSGYDAKSACAILDDGSLVCWGDGNYKQLGRNSTTDSKVPIYVTMPANKTVVQISAGYSRFCAVMDDGTAYCWGYHTVSGCSNWQGGCPGLGDGSTKSSHTPVKMTLPTGRKVTSIMGPSSATCVSLDNGQVACLGYGNGAGQYQKKITLTLQYTSGTNSLTNTATPSTTVASSYAQWVGTPTTLDSTGTVNSAWVNSSTAGTSYVQDVNIKVIPAFTHASTTVTSQLNTSMSLTLTSNCSWCTYTVSPALPTGLSLNTASGTISGTPTSASNATIYSITAKAYNGSYTDTITLTVNNIAPSITSPASSTQYNMTRGQNPLSSIIFSNTGGEATSWGISPALPTGLTFNTSTGEITGTPAVNDTAGTTYTIWANNSKGSSSVSITITINEPAASITPSTASVNLTRGTAMTSISFANTGGAVKTWEVHPALPAGLTLNAGTISGTPTVNMTTTTFTIYANNSGGWTSTTITITIDEPVAALTASATTVTLTRGTDMTDITFSNSGGVIATWSIEPALPAGLTFSTSSGTISGTPTVNSTATSYKVYANNSGGSATVSISITINEPLASITTSASSVNLTRSVTMTSVIITNSGGMVESWAIDPSLPAGLSFSTVSGTISGTPTVNMTSTTFTIWANNSGGAASTNVSITIDEPVAALTASVTSLSLTRGTAMGAITMSNTGGAVAMWGIDPSLPAGLTFSTSSGSITGTPTVNQTQVTYTIWANNSGGSASVQVNLTINEPLAVISGYVNSVTLTRGSAMSAIVFSNTGGAIATWEYDPALPSGLTFNKGPGSITGTPLVNSTSTTYTFWANNSGGSASRTFTITINEPVAVLSISTTSSTLTRGLSMPPVTLTNTGGAIATFAISPALPTGLTLSSTTGSISGTPTVNSTATIYTVYANNTGGSASKTITITINEPASSLNVSSTNSVLTRGTTMTDVTISTSGGIVEQWAIDPALPAGLAFSLTTGSVTGTPIVNMSTTIFTIWANNTGGSSAVQISITINEPVPVLSASHSTATLTRSEMMSVITMSNTGGMIATWQIHPALPAGLFFSSSTGAITGTPSVNMTSTTYTIWANNSGGATSVSVSITINEPVAILSPSLSATNLTRGVMMTPLTMTNTGGMVAVWAIHPALPAGLSFDSTSGAISGTPIVNMTTQTWTVWANNSGGAAFTTIAITINEPIAVLSISNTTSTLIRTVQAWPITITNSGGAIASFAIEPELPPGLSFNLSTGMISGIPTTSGVQDEWTIWANNTGGSASVTVNLTIIEPPAVLTPSVTSTILTRGVQMNTISISNTGGVVDTWSIEPALPNGLDFSPSNGSISGTPTVNMTVNVYTVWANNTAASVPTTITLTVLEPVAKISASTTGVILTRDVTMSAITFNNTGGNVASWEIIPALPVGLLFDSSTGRISGTPSVNMTTTTYTIRAINTGGTDEAFVSIRVLEPAPIISPTSEEMTLTRGVPMTVISVNNSGGVAATWAINPELPTGLEFNTSNGQISGRPLVNMTTTTTYTIWANSSGGSHSITVNLTILEPSAVITPSIAYAIFTRDTAAQNITFSTSGGAIETWAIEPALPAGMIFNSTTGAISGTPIVNMTATTYNIWANNSGGPTFTTITLVINEPLAYLAISMPHQNLTTGVLMEPIKITNHGGVAAEWGISPDLPAGLLFNTTTLTIEGSTVITLSRTTFTIWANNTGGTTSIDFTMGVLVDLDGDTIPDIHDTDDDGDGVSDEEDQFPKDPSEQTDTDGDGIGNNADTDDDGDEIEDEFDRFPVDPNEHSDNDGDGIGDNNDTDDDNDGVDDVDDRFPADPNESEDTDGDGTGDNNDTDDDGDGVPDGADDFPLDSRETIDTDSDGIGDNNDTDDDDDGVPDVEDLFPLDPSRWGGEGGGSIVITDPINGTQTQNNTTENMTDVTEPTIVSIEDLYNQSQFETPPEEIEEEALVEENSTKSKRWKDRVESSATVAGAGAWGGFTFFFGWRRWRRKCDLCDSKIDVQRLHENNICAACREDEGLMLSMRSNSRFSGQSIGFTQFQSDRDL